MQQNLWRAVLLAVTILMLGAMPVIAQTSNERTLLPNDDGSVLIGIQNDVTLAAGDEANAIRTLI